MKTSFVSPLFIKNRGRTSLYALCGLLLFQSVLGLPTQAWSVQSLEAPSTQNATTNSWLISKRDSVNSAPQQHPAIKTPKKPQAIAEPKKRLSTLRVQTSSQRAPKLSLAPLPKRGTTAPACVQHLLSLGFPLEVEPVTQYKTGSCSERNLVKLSAINGSKLSTAAYLNCPTASGLVQWVTQVLQPQAQASYKQPIQSIHNMSSFSCRHRTNSRGKKVLSEHGKANAFDFGGVLLADGHRLRIKNDWNGKRVDRNFLRSTSLKSCNYFKLVLSPKSNAAHADHLHFDQGAWQICEG